MLAVKLDLQLDFSRLENAMAAAGKRTVPAIDRAIGRAATMARTAMVRELVPQTGLKYRVIRKALFVTKGAGTASIRSRGGNVRLKYFAPRETHAGVSAAPWNVRQVFAGTFMKGGRFPKRVPLKMGGHVYKRTGSKRLPITGGRSGLYIPEDMISGASAGAFYSTVGRVIPDRLAHELSRIFG